MKTYKIFSFILSGTLMVGSAFACDICPIQNSINSQRPIAGRFGFGVTENFTSYGNLRSDGEQIENEMHQKLSSSITQIVAIYDYTDRSGVQVSLPYLNRRFTRVEGGELERGTEAGIGDMTIIGRYLPYQYEDKDSYLGIQLLGGIELPTGGSDRLKEELSEDHHDEEMDGISNITRHGESHHEEVPSVIHGHDLALGSGSVDFPVGVSIFAERGRFFLKGGATYSVRTAGDHSYQYGDNFIWDVGPAYYVHLSHGSSVAVRAVLSGEQKSKDSGAGGAIQEDTGRSTVFAGPEFQINASDNISAEIGLDFPVSIDNSGTQAVVSERMRGGLTYRF